MKETRSKRTAIRPRVTVSLGLVLGALLLSVGYFLHRARPAPGRSGESAPILTLAARTLVPRVHILGGLKPSAVYVVETSEGLVLIDSGLEADAKPLKSAMAQLGLDWRKVRAILLTHAHGDHCGGAEYLRQTIGAKVYAGSGDAGVLRAGGPREAFFGTFSMPDEFPHPTAVDVELHGGESLSLGDVRFRAISTPGHTPGSLCYLLERDEFRALFAGDVITRLSGQDDIRNGSGTPLGTYSAYLAPRYRGNAKDYLESLRRLRALPVPDLVLPGHPAGDPTPQSPALSQRRWAAILDDGILEMEALVGRYETDGADFLDGVPKLLLPELYYLGDFEGQAVYVFFASSHLFLVDVPGGAGLLEFVKSRLRQLGRDLAESMVVLLTSGRVESRVGLEEVVAKCHARVIAPPDGLEGLRRSLPDEAIVISALDPRAMGWLKATIVPLRWRGVGMIAYQIELDGKKALFSGRIPAKVTPRSVAGLAAEIDRAKSDAPQDLESLEAIRGLRPDLWLPSTPMDGQNANLYDQEWERVIDQNRDVIRFILSRTRLN